MSCALIAVPTPSGSVGSCCSTSRSDPARRAVLALVFVVVDEAEFLRHRFRVEPHFLERRADDPSALRLAQPMVAPDWDRKVAQRLVVQPPRRADSHRPLPCLEFTPRSRSALAPSQAPLADDVVAEVVAVDALDRVRLARGDADVV